MIQARSAATIARVDLPDLWREHQSATFPPRCMEQRIEGITLARLDALAGAILTACLRSDGIIRPLGDAQKEELLRYNLLVRRVLDGYPIDDEGRAYFERLHPLSGVVFGP